MNKKQYIVIGTFNGCNDDVVLDYFDTEKQARKFAENISDTKYIDDYGTLEFVTIYEGNRKE